MASSAPTASSHAWRKPIGHLGTPGVAYTILVADFLQKAAEGLLGTVPNRVVLIICNTCRWAGRGLKESQS